MAVERIIVLSALIAQTLSAPSGCIESCNFYETYQSRRTSGGYQEHAGLQGSANLNGYDYAKPGNWTEHNRYDTDGGHGKVHEERGQYVDSSKRVRYYKKNFTSSYGADANEADRTTTELRESSGQRRYDSSHLPSEQNTYHDQIGQTITKESGYSSLHSQQTQSASTRIDDRNEKLEDFGEYGVQHSRVNQRVPGVDAQTVPGNWSRADAYRTDGGRGRVFEEEGQYVTGPKKVRYYKKNYTSSYSTSAGVPQVVGNVGATTLNELHSELEKNLHEELDNFRREFHQTVDTGHTVGATTTHVDSTRTGLTRETIGSLHGNDLQTAESDNYGQQLGYRRLPTSPTTTGVAHHYTEQQQRETYTDTRQPLPYTRPATHADAYGAESQRTYESHVSSQGHTAHTGGQASGIVRLPLYRTDGYPTHSAHSSGHHHAVDETQFARGRFLSAHQSNVAQDQLYTGNAQGVYNPTPSYPVSGAYPVGETRRYEERWSTTSHTGGGGSPHDAERPHYDRVAYNEQRGRYQGQSYQGQRYDSRSDYNTAYGTHTGQLVTGSLDVGHVGHAGHEGHGADCTEETQQYRQQETRYHRKYKRDVRGDDAQQRQTTEEQVEYGQRDDDRHSEDLTQQRQSDDDSTRQNGKLEFGNQRTIDHGQNLEDFTQQLEQLRQIEDMLKQIESHKREFGQQTVGNQHMEDLTQQTQESDDLTQQNGKLEFGQQTVDSQHTEDIGNQHMEDLTQQTQEFDDTQRTSGKLEFGQQTIDNQHSEDLGQQFEQLRQIAGMLQQIESHKREFGQQTVDSQHTEDLTQQTQESDDLTQQSGKLEFGQQTIGNQHSEDLGQQLEQLRQITSMLQQIESHKREFGQQTVDSQHTEDLTQQTQESDDLTQQSGKLEFGQQTIGNQHSEDLGQQLEQLRQITSMLQQIESHKREFGQQTVDSQHTEDLTQQTQESDDLTQQSGKLEFGQQTIGNQHSEDLTQQTQEFDDSQQTSGKLEFGQQTIDNQHTEDLTQQSEQFAQQMEGQLEFGQQSIGDRRFEDLMQQRDSEGQHTVGSGFEFGQQTDKTQRLEQFPQRTPRSDDLTQWTTGQLEFGRHDVDSQHLEDLTQQSERFAQQTDSDDFTQQIGKLEFGQQSADKSAKLKDQHPEEFDQQLEFGQQTQQRPHGSDKPKTGEHLEDLFSQRDEDLTQQVGGLEIFAQQTGSSEQQREQQRKPNWPDHNAQRSEHFSQQDNWDMDGFSQHSRQYPTYGGDNEQSSEWRLEQMSQQTDLDRDFTQQTNYDQQSAAEMPKPWQGHRKHNSASPHADGTDTNVDDFFNPIEINPEADIDNSQRRNKEHVNRLTRPISDHRASNILQNQGSGVFDNENGNMDWTRNSNDAAVGLQWYNTHHPSDLTNVEGSHDNYYSQRNVDSMSQQTEYTQQQTGAFDYDRRETRDEHTFESSTRRDAYASQSSQEPEQIPSRVIPLQQHQNPQYMSGSDERSMQTTEEPKHKIESRILEAFGGGPYDGWRNDDIYSRLTPNPKAILPPVYFDDSWDIREKPREVIRPREFPAVTMPKITTAPATEMIETTTEQMIETTTESAPPSFWRRLGHKITNTYDKAKERAKEIFG